MKKIGNATWTKPSLLKSTCISRVSNCSILKSFWNEQDTQVEQNIGRNLIGPLNSGTYHNKHVIEAWARLT